MTNFRSNGYNQRGDIMVKAGTIVEEAITTKVGTKIILEEDLDVGYAIKITISA